MFQDLFFTFRSPLFRFPAENPLKLFSHSLKERCNKFMPLFQKQYIQPKAFSVTALLTIINNHNQHYL